MDPKGGAGGNILARASRVNTLTAATKLRRNINAYWNHTFRANPTSKNVYNSFTRRHPGKSAFNAISNSNFKNNSNAKQLRQQILRGVLDIPEEQRLLAQQYKNVLARGSPRRRTRRNNRK